MGRMWSVLVAAVLLAAAPGPAVAGAVAPRPAEVATAALGTSVSWTRAASGPADIWDATAFAASTGELVQVGGMTVTADTRLFNPSSGAWTTLKAPRSGWPSARTFTAMAWDPVHKRVVLFGGRAPNGTVLQDTWAFDPATRSWSRLVDCKRAACPPARHAHALAWSAVLSRIVLFGGAGMSGATGTPVYNDTWAFDGTAWTKLATTGAPAGRILFGMAEDASTGRLVVFGGVDGSNRIVDTATWLLDTRTKAWTRLDTPTVPWTKAQMGMAWLGTLRAVVIATGQDGVDCTSHTSGAWAFDAAAGDRRVLTAAGATPTPRNAASLTANPLDGSAILIGGTGDNAWPITLVDRAWILR